MNSLWMGEWVQVVRGVKVVAVVDEMEAKESHEMEGSRCVRLVLLDCFD